MNEATSPLLFGPCGWNLEPRTRPSLHELDRISSAFDAVEISTSGAAMLRPEIVNVWSRKVSKNPRFRFSVVLHRMFTEGRNLDRDAVARFHESIAPLERTRTLGCVLMRFPWQFRFTEENRKFFIQLRRTFSAFPLAAEMRHGSWLRDEAIGTFLDHHVGFVNIDQALTVNAMPPSSFLTSAIGYVRLTREQKDVEGRVYPGYSQESLEEWKGRIEKVSRFSTRTFVVGALSTPQASERCAARIAALHRAPEAAPLQPLLFSVA